MKKILVITILLAMLSGQSEAATKNVKGLWLTENKRAAIRIEDCNGKLCGYVAWIIKGGMQTDSKNPDASKRRNPICGLPVLWNFKQNANNLKVWEDGRIYKADEGDIYHATITTAGADILHLRGYVGIPLLGKSQSWTRVSDKDYPACK